MMPSALRLPEGKEDEASEELEELEVEPGEAENAEDAEKEHEDEMYLARDPVRASRNLPCNCHAQQLDLCDPCSLFLLHMIPLQVLVFFLECHGLIPPISGSQLWIFPREGRALLFRSLPCHRQLALSSHARVRRVRGGALQRYRATHTCPLLNRNTNDYPMSSLTGVSL